MSMLGARLSERALWTLYHAGKAGVRGPPRKGPAWGPVSWADTLQSISPCKHWGFPVASYHSPHHPIFSKLRLSALERLPQSPLPEWRMWGQSPSMTEAQAHPCLCRLLGTPSQMYVQEMSSHFTDRNGSNN